jgi:hypothetical protein
MALRCSARISPIDRPVRSAAARSSCSIRGVSWRPGRTPFTVTPSAATDRETVFSQAMSADRPAFEYGSSGIGCLTVDERIATIRPQRAARICGRRRVASSIGVVARSWNAALQPSGSVAVGSTGGGPPALSTRMSIPSRAATASAAMAAALPGSVASEVRTATVSPWRASSSRATGSNRSRDRDQIASRQPSAARDSAAARPSPLEAPPMSARRPSIPRSIVPPLTRSASDPGPAGYSILAPAGRMLRTWTIPRSPNCCRNSTGRFSIA